MEGGRDEWEKVLEDLAKVLSALPSHTKDLLLGSMTTRPHPLAREVYEMFHDFNANDEALYTKVREMELEVVRTIGSLFNCRGACDGMITTGGTESNLAALYLAREHGYRTVYAAETAHYSIQKAAKVLGMRYVQVPHRGFKIDVNALSDACRSHGKGVVVATVGTTGVGTIDPVREVSQAAEECDSVVHVDAAYGGLVAPFIYAGQSFGFDNGAVVSVAVDPHKLGLVPLQAGGLILRDHEWSEPLYFEASYLPAGRQMGLLGTRSAGPVAATWAMLKYFGLEGYGEQARELMERLDLLRRLLSDSGLRLVVDPEVPIACIADERPQDTMKALWSHGAYVYVCGVAPGVRVVIMPHVTDDKVREFVRVLSEVKSKA